MGSSDSKTFRFGTFCFESTTRTLTKSGTPIRLQVQPALVLEYLLEHSGQVVTRRELHEKLWPGDVHVEFENGLNSCIGRLRQALSDSASQPRYIETIPRSGYRWIAPLEHISVPAAVVATESAIDVVPPQPLWNRRNAILATAGVAAGGIGFRLAFPPNRRPPPRHSSFLAPAGQILGLAGGRSVAIDADGTKVAYVGAREGKTTVYLYDSAIGHEPEVVAVSNDAASPCFSPDGATLTWGTAKGLLTSTGGQIRPLRTWQPAASLRSCRYTPGGDLLFMEPTAALPQEGRGLATNCYLWRRGAASPTRIDIPFGGKGIETLIPQQLLRGRFLIYSTILGPLMRGIWIMDLNTGKRNQLISPGMGGMTVAGDRLIYYWEGNLLMAELDLPRLALRNNPVVVLSGVAAAGWTGPDADLSADGTLVYLPLPPQPDHRFVWRSLDGKESTFPLVPGPFTLCDLSTDGRHVLLHRRQAGDTGPLLHYDLKTGQTQELAKEADGRACWGPEAKRVVCSMFGAGEWLPTLHVIDTNSKATLWKTSFHGVAQFGQQWVASTDEIFFLEGYRPSTRIDIWKVKFGDEKTRQPIAAAGAVETHPRVSPDGRLLAYSILGNPSQVRLRRTAQGAEAEVSIPAPAALPMWSANGQTLYFRSGRATMGIDVRLGAKISFGPIRQLFEGDNLAYTQWQAQALFDPSSNRFLLTKLETEPEKPRKIQVITNWLTELG